ncbi:MAG: hypothetical protein EOO92_28865 [Pedobacter sp.]|nr:MAG: hypothetical protein EOO92_28865 [Pedobacter sp.]
MTLLKLNKNSITSLSDHLEIFQELILRNNSLITSLQGGEGVHYLQKNDGLEKLKAKVKTADGQKMRVETKGSEPTTTGGN